MDPTKAQLQLLDQLSRGAEVTLENGYYTVILGSVDVGRIWPNTFHGLYNYGALHRKDDGNYVISDAGKQLLWDNEST